MIIGSIDVDDGAYEYYLEQLNPRLDTDPKLIRGAILPAARYATLRDKLSSRIQEYHGAKIFKKHALKQRRKLEKVLNALNLAFGDIYARDVKEGDVVLFTNSRGLGLGHIRNGGEKSELSIDVHERRDDLTDIADILCPMDEHPQKRVLVYGEPLLLRTEQREYCGFGHIEAKVLKLSTYSGDFPSSRAVAFDIEYPRARFVPLSMRMRDVGVSGTGPYRRQG